MKRIVAAIAIALLGGCGLDAASSAATAAALKKQQLEQARKTMGDAQQKIGQALELQQQRAEQTLEGADK
jgi:outer membrane biogenesis lipoprotein LolB